MTVKWVDINSMQNQKIKDLVRLRESRFRKKSHTFLVEGFREAIRACENSFKARSVFIRSGIADDELDYLLTVTECDTIFRLSDNIYSKVAIREKTESVIIVFEQKTIQTDRVVLPKHPVIVVLDGLEKPGNIGSILRSCDGAGVNLVIFVGKYVDIYSPAIIRSSLGTVFSMRVLVLENQPLESFLCEHKIKKYGAVISDASQNFHRAQLSERGMGVALFFGTESTGLSDFWKARTHHISIPMRGVSDSLNVSAAAAVILYEATKQ